MDINRYIYNSTNRYRLLKLIVKTTRMANAIRKGINWLFNTEIGIQFLLLALSLAWSVLWAIAFTQTMSNHIY